MYKVVVGNFNIKTAFDISDLFVENGFLSASCLEVEDHWVVEVLSDNELTFEEIRNVINADFTIILNNKLKEENWLQRCFENFQPIDFDGFFIHGNHILGSNIPSNKIAIEISAATAFGTGEHPTTFKCLTACRDFFDSKRHKIVADIGCGSGVIAIALAKLGASHVYAYDNDPEAVRVTAENIIINKVMPYVVPYINLACEFDLRKYDFIVSNILAEPLISMSKNIFNSLNENGILVLSGFLTSDKSVVNAYSALGLTVRYTYEYNGWSTIVFEKNNF